MYAGRQIERGACRTCGKQVVFKNERELAHRCPHYQYCEGPSSPATCCRDLVAAQAEVPETLDYKVVWNGAISRKTGLPPGSMPTR
jgi:hypothetical protein